MSGFKSRLLRGGLIAGTGVLAAGALASSASAAGTAITGAGSSLQGAAMSAWLNPTAAGTTWTRATNHISGGSAAYTVSSSGDGLTRFGNNGGGLASPLPSFVSSDDPATSGATGQLATAAAAAGTDEIFVPIAQAPVAVIVSIPNGITGVTSAQLRVTNRLLADTFRGRVATWGDFLTAAAPGATLGGTGLTTSIELQARATASGTTFSFKGYLASVDPTNWTAFRDGNLNWPSSVTTVNCSVTQSSGGTLVSAVAGDTNGSIGYANLADAIAGGFTNRVASSAVANGPCATRSSQIAYALVQNATTFADPIVTDRSGNQRANTDPSGTWGGTLPSTPTASWENAEPWNTAASSSFYGLNAGTYVVGWDNYSTTQLIARYGSGTGGADDQGDTVRNLAQYLINNTTGASTELFAFNGGQTLLSNTVTPARFYARLPNAVRALAERAADSIN